MVVNNNVSERNYMAVQSNLFMNLYLTIELIIENFIDEIHAAYNLFLRKCLHVIKL